MARSWGRGLRAATGVAAALLVASGGAWAQAGAAGSAGTAQAGAAGSAGSAGEAQAGAAGLAAGAGATGPASAGKAGQEKAGQEKTGQGSAVEGPEAPEAHLEGDRVEWPLVLVKGFPFVEGAVNGLKGKLLFDVGEPAPFALNSHRVVPPNGVRTGHGSFASGQTFPTFHFPVVDELALPGGLELRGIHNVRGNTGETLEQHITPEFIGWIGVRFFRGYVMKLDLEGGKVSFFRDDGSDRAGTAALAGERVVEVVAFDAAEHRNLPSFPVRIGGVPFVATLDTGSHMAIWMNDATRSAMLQAGTLEDGAEGRHVLSGLVVGGQTMPATPVEIREGAPVFGERVGARDGNAVTLGYEFLRRYRTVWDFRKGTLTLLAL